MTLQLTTTRSNSDELAEQRRLVEESLPVGTILNGSPSLMLIINEKREIIFANDQAMQTLQASDLDEILGKRPGEAMRCKHVPSCPDGCGSGDACRMCGAANAIQLAQLGRPTVRDCHILQQDTGAALDFRVSTTPMNIRGHNLVLVALVDVSHENRRRSLERIFFHDLLNTLGALSGYAQLLEGSSESELGEIASAIQRLTETMAEQINEQRDLAAAENNDLAVRPSVVNARELIEQIAVHYRNHSAGHGVQIVVGERAERFPLRTDRRLLQRIIANMLKNALEATHNGEVTLRCFQEDGQAIFEVQNPGAIPKDVQLQIFQRAFSTKGAGRGLGTYSMKLLGERYLRGQISFTSTPESGTTFRASLPLDAAGA